MIRTIIIDDEEGAVELLRFLLEKECGQVVEVVATSNCAAEGRRLLGLFSPDLVFMPIELARMNGLELFGSFARPPFRVIFLASSDACAAEALRLGVTDVLLKPVQETELLRVVQKIKNEIGNDQDIGAKLLHLEKLLSHNGSVPEFKIGICMSDKIVFVNITDIIYCEANGSYTNVCIIDGKRMIASKSLYYFEIQLVNHKFFRAHRSNLINLNRVQEFQKDDGGYVIMENGDKLPVSQRKRKEFLDAINNLII